MRGPACLSSSSGPAQPAEGHRHTTGGEQPAGGTSSLPSSFQHPQGLVSSPSHRSVSEAWSSILSKGRWGWGQELPGEAVGVPITQGGSGRPPQTLVRGRLRVAQRSGQLDTQPASSGAVPPFCLTFSMVASSDMSYTTHTTFACGKRGVPQCDHRLPGHRCPTWLEA